MSKTLYITDLDGTLLSPDASLSDYARQQIKELVGKGISISAATARTAATVKHILAGTQINIPVVLMNGVCTYSLTDDRYISFSPVEPEAAAEVFDILAPYGLSDFLYTIDGGRLHTFYERCETQNAKDFMAERIRLYNKEFTKTDSYRELLGRNIVYYSVTDKEEKLAPAVKQLEGVKGIRTEYYRDIYETDSFYLEICSEKASKHTAVDFLRTSCGFDRIIGFGDNLNDLPLLEACDEFYAVENAVEAIKAKANGVIKPNYENGVIKWLCENAQP